MAITDIPILAMLRTRLEWAQARQHVLSENVANADTPGFRPHDLVPAKFNAAGEPAGRLPPVTLVRTNSRDIAGKPPPGDGFRSRTGGPYDVVPSGNAVNLPQEMMKVAANQMDYEAVSALYIRSLNLIKTALGTK